MVITPFVVLKGCVFVHCLHHTSQYFLALKNNYRWLTIISYLALCIKQVESRNNWSDLVPVILVEALLTQRELFWHQPDAARSPIAAQQWQGEHPSALWLCGAGAEPSCFAPASSKGFCKTCCHQLRWTQRTRLSLAKVKCELLEPRKSETQIMIRQGVLGEWWDGSRTCLNLQWFLQQWILGS